MENTSKWKYSPPSYHHPKTTELDYQNAANSEFPGISHHHNKVDVCIDGGAHTSVIIHKLLLGHLQRGAYSFINAEESAHLKSVSVQELLVCGPQSLTSTHTDTACLAFLSEARYLSIFVIRRVKAIQECPEDLVLRPLSVLVLGVVLGVVNTPQVFDGDHPVTRFIQLPKRLHDHLLPGLGHWRLQLTEGEVKGVKIQFSPAYDTSFSSLKQTIADCRLKHPCHLGAFTTIFYSEQLFTLKHEH